MRVHRLHEWDISPTDAVALQRELAGQLRIDRSLPESAVQSIAGVDLSPPDAQTGRVRGAVVVVAWPSFDVIEVSMAEGVADFPYVPGLLSFREAPILLEALSGLQGTPDLVLVDGQGTAHPRRFGIACHLGLAVDVPIVGCAKSRLVGAHEEPGEAKGEWTRLMHRGDVIGAVVRTRTGVRPIYVSPGNNIDLESSVRWALACSPRYRIPVPTRLAHRAAAGESLL